MQKYYTLNVNILLQLITINLQKILLLKKEGLVNKSTITTQEQR